MSAHTTPNTAGSNIPLSLTRPKADRAAMRKIARENMFSKSLFAHMDDDDTRAQEHAVDFSPTFAIGNSSDSEDQPVSPSPSSYVASNDNSITSQSSGILDSSFEHPVPAKGRILESNGTIYRNKGKGRATGEEANESKNEEPAYTVEEEGRGPTTAEKHQQESRDRALAIQLMKADLRSEGHSEEAIERIIFEQTSPRSFLFLLTTRHFPVLSNDEGEPSRTTRAPFSNKGHIDVIETKTSNARSPPPPHGGMKSQSSTGGSHSAVLRSAHMSRSRANILIRPSDSGSSRGSAARRATSLDNDWRASRRSSPRSWDALMGSAGKALSWPAVPFATTGSFAGGGVEKAQLQHGQHVTIRPPIPSKMKRACIFPEDRVRYVRHRREIPDDRLKLV